MMPPPHQEPSTPPWLDRQEYPFRSRWWETPAGRMHYLDEGTGQPVVFVHGVPAWSYNFRRAIRHLSGTHRCVAVDHLGFGLSDKPADWGYDPPALSGHLEELIAALGLRDLTLVVHDWGGPLGLAYALRQPENVSRLILLNTWLWSSEGDRRARFAAWLLGSPLYMALEERFALTPRLFTRLAVTSRKRLHPGTYAHFEGPFRRRQDRAGLQALVRGLRDWDGWVGGLWEQRDRIRDIPTLILWGMKDPAFPPRYLRQWEELFTHATVERMENAGHYPHEEAPERVCDLLAGFLSGSA